MLAVAQKEVFHILRDPRTLMIIFILPVLQLVIFGYAMNMELRRVPLLVEDLEKNSLTREITLRFVNSGYFSVIESRGSGLQPDEPLRSRIAQASLCFPPDFGNSRSDLQLTIDASDPNTAQLIQAYASAIINKYAAENGSILDIRPLIMFNPDLKSSFFFVPGLIAMILVMVCALLTSISISSEKEVGTLEQVMVSPVSPTEILLGKVIPYILLGLMDALLILAVGILLFHVPFRGNFIIFLGFTLLYILTALCLGLMVSTIAKTQQAAMMMAMAITLLPTMLLSGFIFPISSMPKILQVVTYIVPARYYLQIIRGIMLKGNSIAQLYQAGLSLLVMSVVMMLVAVKRFRLKIQ